MFLEDLGTDTTNDEVIKDAQGALTTFYTYCGLGAILVLADLWLMFKSPTVLQEVASLGSPRN